MKFKLLQMLTTLIFGYGIHTNYFCRWIYYDEKIPTRVKELAKEV